MGGATRSSTPRSPGSRTDTTDAIRLLRHQIDDLQLTNERLLRRLQAAGTAQHHLSRQSVEASVDG